MQIGTQIKFTKMEALGNDFIFLDVLENPKLQTTALSELAFELCNRRSGIGADGLIFLDATKSGLEENRISTRIFNADGSEVETSGNGIRCAARLAYDRVYTKGKREFALLLEKIKRKVTVFVDENDVTIDMGQAVIEGEEKIEFNGETIKFSVVNIGNPHAVIFVKDLDMIDLPSIGQALESKEELFPDGVNVQIAQAMDSTNIKLKTWERGVGETFACGSGACSTVATAIKKGLCEDTSYVTMPGGKVKVTRRGTSMFLTGPVNYVFKGEI